MMTFFRNNLWLIIILSLFSILGILRLNDLSLYTDCTRYLIWGNSIAHGNGFVDNTQPEPEYYVVNAPFYSVILAPVLLIFPLSLSAAKIWTLLWGIFAIILFYRWMQIYLNKYLLIAATIFFALNPLTLVLSTEILSETSFLCAIFAVFLILQRLENDHTNRWELVILVIILSVITLIREVGIALVAASIVFLLSRKRQRTAILVFLGAAILFALWTYRNLGIVGAPASSQGPNLVYIFKHFVTPADTPLYHEIIQRAIINFRAYSLGLSGQLLYSFPNNLIVHSSGLFNLILSIINFLMHYAFVIIIPLIIRGIVLDFNQSKTAMFRILFVSIYLCIMLLYPVQDVRFLFPLLPIVLFFIFSSIHDIILKIRLTNHTGIISGVILFTVLLFPNIICIYEIMYTNLSYRKDPINFCRQQSVTRDSYFSIPWSVIGNWINHEVPANSIIASPAKEIVPFASNNKFLELNRAVPLPIFESLLRDNAVEYLLAPFVYDSIVEYQTMIDESKRFRFERLHSINRMVVFKVHSRLEESINRSENISGKYNMETTQDKFRLGRLALVNGRYDDASVVLSKLCNQFPQISDLVYQMLLVSTFKLDSLKAEQYLRQLYQSPIATSFVAPAQIHIRAMNSFLFAGYISDPLLRAEKIFETSKTYWYLGYPNQAYKLIQQAIQVDSTFFVGLLWAWHYGTQVGDTIGVQKYLMALENIDRDNPIVRSYQRITSHRKNLRSQRNPIERCELYLRLSHEYDSLELSDEAIDEAQRAVGENPTNKTAWLALSNLFKKRHSPFASNRALLMATKYN
jgi:tetratricopeptide (TPR) repeat protein